MKDQPVLRFLGATSQFIVHVSVATLLGVLAGTIHPWLGLFVSFATAFAAIPLAYYVWYVRPY